MTIHAGQLASVVSANERISASFTVIADEIMLILGDNQKIEW